MRRVSDDFKAFIERQEPELSQGLAQALESTEPSVSVRLNPHKLGEVRPDVVNCDGVTSVPWCAHGFYLPVRPDFTHDPALHQGLYYVQDASSMIISHVVGQLAAKSPVRYLDACAAPGGKTTAAIDALPEGSLVVANEFDFRRAEILKENVSKWGCPGVVVSRGDTARFRNLPGWFDIISADVPCSGEGMMRKDETARSQWSEALVGECAARQREIVGNLWPALRPGGYLIYSTCTFNRKENEEIVGGIVEATGAEIVEVGLPAGCGGIVVRGGMLRFLPSRLLGEGLFLAVLRKRDDDITCEYGGGRRTYVRKGDGRRSGKNGAKDTAVKEMTAMAEDCQGWVAGGHEILLRDNEVCAVAGTHVGALCELEGRLDVIYRGVSLGERKGQGIVPSQSLAMSLALNPCAFPVVDVDFQSALSYLRRESLPGFDAPRGHILVRYEGHPLGFVNHIGNRSNNLYPMAWRILK